MQLVTDGDQQIVTNEYVYYFLAGSQFVMFGFLATYNFVGYLCKRALRLEQNRFHLFMFTILQVSSVCGVLSGIFLALLVKS
jgi:hypothetical protein